MEYLHTSPISKVIVFFTGLRLKRSDKKTICSISDIKMFFFYTGKMGIIKNLKYLLQNSH